MTDTNQTNTSQCAAALTVLYDGACPLCRREIAVYRDLQPLQPGSPVCFADVSNAAVSLPTVGRPEDVPCAARSRPGDRS